MKPHQHQPEWDTLLVKYILKECDATEAKQVEDWISLHDDNALYIQQVERIWNESKSILERPSVNEEEAWLRLKTKLESTPPKLSTNRWWWYAAAGVVLAVLAYLLMDTPSTSQRFAKGPSHDTLPLQKNKNRPQKVEFITVESKLHVLSDTLPDQSVITMNKNTSVQYPDQFAKNERRIRLDGEAFFSISPDKTKPFFIDAGQDVEIRVVGTSFNVKANDEFTEVIVETGIVEVRKFNRVVLLHPREKAKIRKSDSTITVQKNTDKLHRYYRNKEFICENLPLWRLVEVLNEAYGDSVRIERKELRGLTLDTQFDNLSLEQILELLSETFELKVNKKQGKYYLN